MASIFHFDTALAALYHQTSSRTVKHHQSSARVCIPCQASAYCSRQSASSTITTRRQKRNRLYVSFVRDRLWSYVEPVSEPELIHRTSRLYSVVFAPVEIIFASAHLSAFDSVEKVSHLIIALPSGPLTDCQSQTIQFRLRSSDPFPRNKSL